MADLSVVKNIHLRHQLFPYQGFHSLYNDDMKTYKFKLYQHKRNKHLHRTINAASIIYNHSIGLHKRYYRIFGKHLNKNRLQKHIAKLRRKNEYWQLVGSQATQEIADRIERAYQLFFKHHGKGVRPPNFRKRIKYKSFTLKQAVRFVPMKPT